MENGNIFDIKNAVSLTDDEMEQFTGGKSRRQSATPPPPVFAPPPVCFCSRKKDMSFLVPARCSPYTECPYYKDCRHPGRIKK